MRFSSSTDFLWSGCPDGHSLEDALVSSTSAEKPEPSCLLAAEGGRVGHPLPSLISRPSQHLDHIGGQFPEQGPNQHHLGGDALPRPPRPSTGTTQLRSLRAC